MGWRVLKLQLLYNHTRAWGTLPKAEKARRHEGFNPSSSNNSNHRLRSLGASQMALVVKNLPSNAGDVRDPGAIPWVGTIQGEESTATHSSILAWKLPWTEEPGGAMVHRVAKSWTRLRQLNTHQELAYARHCPCTTSFNL